MSSERTLASEVPIRMNFVRPCSVVLDRLTDEQIHRWSYKDIPTTNILNNSSEIYGTIERDFDFENDDLEDDELEDCDDRDDDSDFEISLSSRNRYYNNQRRFNLREHSDSSGIFEAYRQTRQSYLNKKSFYNSDNSMEFSQDESKNSETSKPKRKSKKGRYELDMEWNPKQNYNYNSLGKKCKRKRVYLESETSESDDEIFDFLMEESSNSAFDNTVPSSSDANESLSSNDPNSNSVNFENVLDHNSDCKNVPAADEVAKVPKRKRTKISSGTQADKTNTIVESVLKSLLRRVSQELSIKKKPKKQEGNNTSAKRINAKSSVLKNMAMHEKQRLLFVDINNKKRVKQYSHCRRLSDNATDKINDSAADLPDLTQNTVNFKPSIRKNLAMQQPARVNKIRNSRSNIEQQKHSIRTDIKNDILEKSDKNLFLVTFPQSNNQSSIENRVTNNVKNVRINGSNKAVIPVFNSSVNVSFPVYNKMPVLQHQTVYLPLLPSVIVSNFVPPVTSSNEFVLKDCFYQGPVTLSSSSSTHFNIQKNLRNACNVQLTNSVNYSISSKPQPDSLVTSDRGIGRNKLESSVLKRINIISNNSSKVSNNLNAVQNGNRKNNQNIKLDDQSLAYSKVDSEESELAVRKGNSKISKLSVGLSKSELLELNSPKVDQKRPLTNSGADESTNNSLEKSYMEDDFEDNNFNQDLLSSACHELGAISILAVIDLEKNPKAALSVRIQIAKKEVVKSSKDKLSDEAKAAILAIRNDLQTLYLAQKYLNLYGSFSRVSDHFLRKEKMIQIKKEMFEEHERNESSCCFSETQPILSNTEKELEVSKATDVVSPIPMKTELMASCRLSEVNTNHIQKLQSQVASMNNSVSLNESLTDTNIIQNFLNSQMPLPPSMAAPTPVTPRNDPMSGESRETPSRGSGPRTPARPESATSQPEESALNSVIQIKRELMESSSIHIAYTQNASLPHISNQNASMPQIPNPLPVIPDINLNVMNQQIPTNAFHPISVSSVSSMLTSSQSSLPHQSREVAPNRTVIQNNKHVNDFYPRFQNVPISVSNVNSITRQTEPSYFGQTTCFPNGMPSRQPSVPSLNNQYAANFSQTSGGLLVNYAQQAAGGNVNSLLTNISNQQFYTSNQSQLYYQQAPAQAVDTTTNIASPTANLVQPTASEVIDQMFCAVCKNVATLRCKQCAKVAYCNTTCAKTYWHQKHKMECKPLPS